MKETIFFYLLTNLSITISYFIHDKTGRVNMQEPWIRAGWFIAIGLPWFLLIVILKAYYRWKHKKGIST